MHATCNIPLKSYQQGLQLCLKTSLRSEVCTRSYAPSKSQESQCCNFESLGTKSHFVVAAMERRRVYYKGGSGGFPQVRAVVSLVCPSCSWFVLAPKVLQQCTNHLVLVLWRFVWVNKAYHFFLVPSQSSNTPLYPSIVLWAEKHAPTLSPSAIFNLGLTFESLKELGVRCNFWFIIFLWGSKYKVKKDCNKK